MENLKKQIEKLNDIIRFQKFKIKNLEKERDKFKDLYLESTKNEKIEENNSEEICLICHEDINYDKIITTCCKNLFHQRCLDKWYTYKKICPICKT